MSFPSLALVAGGCGACGVALLLLLAGGGAIDWMMFVPFLIAAFLAIVVLVFAVAWIVATLTHELDSTSGTSQRSLVMRWPQDFPGTHWLFRRCFVIAATAIAMYMSLAWAGQGIWKGWSTPEMVFAAVIAIVGTLSCEAAYWLVRNWRHNQSITD